MWPLENTAMKTTQNSSKEEENGVVLPGATQHWSLPVLFGGVNGRLLDVYNVSETK